MKKIILVFILLGIIVGLGVTEQVCVSKTFDNALNQSRSITQAIQAEDYEAAAQMTQDMSDWWSKKRDILEFVCPNNDIKVVMVAIGDLKGALDAEMWEDSLQKAVLLTYTVENSKNLLTFKWKNVL
ncbi:MAG: DUF4363 family protein [Clostridia bacterium]|nr:DUF4363 family protein [Clostridia bacterium]